MGYVSLPEGSLNQKNLNFFGGQMTDMDGP